MLGKRRESSNSRLIYDGFEVTELGLLGIEVPVRSQELEEEDDPVKPKAKGAVEDTGPGRRGCMRGRPG